MKPWLALLLTPSIATGQNTLSFKEDTLRMTFSDFISKHPKAVVSKEVRFGTRAVFEFNATAAEKPVQTIYSFKYLPENPNQSPLYEIRLTFNTSDFGHFRRAYTSKFGDPTSVTEKTVQNQMGATFSCGVCKWEIGEFQIEIKERASKIDKGSIVYLDPKLAEEAMKATAAEGAKSASDL